MQDGLKQTHYGRISKEKKEFWFGLRLQLTDSFFPWYEFRVLFMLSRPYWSTQVPSMSLQVVLHLSGCDKDARLLCKALGRVRCGPVRERQSQRMGLLFRCLHQLDLILGFHATRAARPRLNRKPWQSLRFAAYDVPYNRLTAEANACRHLRWRQPLIRPKDHITATAHFCIVSVPVQPLQPVYLVVRKAMDAIQRPPLLSEIRSIFAFLEKYARITSV